MLKIAGREILNGDGHETAFSLLKTLWQEETDKPFPEIARTDRGKPYFLGENLHFSITHTKKYAFCALSDRTVGIDAEELERKINPALAEKILSPGELTQYTVAEDKNKALLTFWVLKEAAAKCSGEGLRGYPNQTDFPLTDTRVEERMGCLVAVITDEEKMNAF
jgi:4'-phosphopantetheinyl transferase